MAIKRKPTLSELSSFLKETQGAKESTKPEKAADFLQQQPSQLVDVEKVSAKNTATTLAQTEIPSEEALVEMLHELAEREGRSVDELILSLMSKSKASRPTTGIYLLDLALQTHLSSLHLLYKLYERNLRSMGFPL
ncbi:hypothetical protein [Eisenibacter elegans]|jgi:hypothetical protein|uniref:hypothetical protein n=1 Tax=Eisenibacter elegans TaxID=997 RepID=UPI0004214435|nr:hypothetical protein [Eisenibacter elegans]